jgi:hypothetical protein
MKRGGVSQVIHFHQEDWTKNQKGLSNVSLIILFSLFQS